MSWLPNSTHWVRAAVPELAVFAVITYPKAIEPPSHLRDHGGIGADGANFKVAFVGRACAQPGAGEVGRPPVSETSVYDDDLPMRTRADLQLQSPRGEAGMRFQSLSKRPRGQ